MSKALRRAGLPSPPLLARSCLFVFLPHVGNSHFGVKPVNLLSGMAVAQAQAETRCKADFVYVQNLLDDSLESKTNQSYPTVIMRAV